jgi:hypothetical protein
MKWVRLIALTIGITFGLIYLISFLLDFFNGLIPIRLSNIIFLFFGPIMILTGALIALKFERIGGWILIIGGIINLLWIGSMLTSSDFLFSALFLVIPMFIIGGLHLLSVNIQMNLKHENLVF